MNSKIEQNLITLNSQWINASEKSKFLNTHSLHSDFHLSNKKIQLAGKPRLIKWFINKINQYVNSKRYNGALRHLEILNAEITLAALAPLANQKDLSEKKKELLNGITPLEEFIKGLDDGSRKQALINRISLLKNKCEPTEESKKRFWTHEELLKSDLDGKELFEFAKEYLRSDRKEALELYAKAAEKGYVPAMLQTGLELRYGFNDGHLIIQKNPQEALKYFEMAFQTSTSNEEKRKACQEIGNMYHLGEIEKDPAKAEKWFNEGRKYGPIGVQSETGAHQILNKLQ